MSTPETKASEASRPTPKVTCYSHGEGAFMEWSQSLRGRLLQPLLSLMSAAGLRAGHITFLSLLSGIAFCPLFLWGSRTAAFTLLLAHVVLDGLDGPLARLNDSLKKPTPRSKLRGIYGFLPFGTGRRPTRCFLGTLTRETNLAQ